MNKIITALALAAFALGAQAASHAGGAPMKAESLPTKASNTHSTPAQINTGPE